MPIGLVNDDWKDDYLARPHITHLEFYNLADEHKLWLIEHKNIFYHVEEKGYYNLLHKRNSELAKKLKPSGYPY